MSYFTVYARERETDIPPRSLWRELETLSCQGFRHRGRGVIYVPPLAPHRELETTGPNYFSLWTGACQWLKTRANTVYHSADDCIPQANLPGKLIDWHEPGVCALSRWLIRQEIPVSALSPTEDGGLGIDPCLLQPPATADLYGRRQARDKCTYTISATCVLVIQHQSETATRDSSLLIMQYQLRHCISHRTAITKPLMDLRCCITLTSFQKPHLSTPNPINHTHITP